MTATEAVTGELQQIPHDLIFPGAYQNRDIFEPIRLEELAQSIRENGILQPITVRPSATNDGSYTIVAGERRWRAAALVGLATVPCIIRQSMDDAAHATATVIENLQRADLTPIEEARGFDTLRTVAGYDIPRIAAAVGYREPYIREALSLLTLPVRVQDYAHVGVYSHPEGHEDRKLLKLTRPQALALVQIMIPDNPDLTVHLAEYALTHGLAAYRITDVDMLRQNALPSIASAQLDPEGKPLPNASLAKIPINAPYIATHCTRCAFGAYLGTKDGYGWNFCAKPAHLVELQARRVRDEEAATAARIAEAQAAIGKPAKEGDKPLQKLSEIGHDNYVDLSRGDLPNGCTDACPCRGLGLGYGDQICVICTDPKRHRGMKGKETRAANKDRRADAKARTQEVVAELDRVKGVELTMKGFSERELRLVIRAALSSITSDTKKIKEAERHLLPYIGRPSLFPEEKAHTYGNSLIARLTKAEMETVPTDALVRFAAEALVRKDLVQYHEYGGTGEYMFAYRGKDEEPDPPTPAPPSPPAPTQPDAIAEMETAVSDLARGSVDLAIADDKPITFISKIGPNDERTAYAIGDDGALTEIVPDPRFADVATISVSIESGEPMAIAAAGSGGFADQDDDPAIGEADLAHRTYEWGREMARRDGKDPDGDTVILVQMENGDHYAFGDDALYLESNYAYDVTDHPDVQLPYVLIPATDAQRAIDLITSEEGAFNLGIAVYARPGSLRGMIWIGDEPEPPTPPTPPAPVDPEPPAPDLDSQLAMLDDLAPAPGTPKGQTYAIAIAPEGTIALPADTVPYGQVGSAPGWRAPDPAPAPTPQRLPNKPLVESFRTMADKMADDIAQKDRPADPNVAMTRKREQELDKRRAEARRLIRIQNALRGLADLWETGQIPDDLAAIRNRATIEDLLTYSNVPSWDGPELDRATKNGLADPSRWIAARVALMEMTDRMDTGKAERDRVRALDALRARVRVQRPQGFFPTPKRLVDHMLQLAEIAAGDEVLEPTAGDGAIATAIRDQYPNAKLTVCEINHDLREILKLEGFTLTDQNDFTKLTPIDGMYDRIVANFPFEAHQSRSMLVDAYSLLRPGGKIVAIIAPNALRGDRPADAKFVEWFNKRDAYVEDLASGAFAPDTQTGGTLVIIDCPAD